MQIVHRCTVLRQPLGQRNWVGRIESGDRVLVGPESGGSLLTDQLTLDGVYTGGETTVGVGTVPAGTPSSGQIRVWNTATTSFDQVTYTGTTASSFTGCSGMPAATTAEDVFVAYIDQDASGTTASFTAIHTTDVPLFIRVRDGAEPIKTFEITGSFTSSGGGSTAVRTSDA